MSISCTILLPGRSDEYGRGLAVGQDYTGPDELVKSMHFAKVAVIEGFPYDIPTPPVGLVRRRSMLPKNLSVPTTSFDLIAAESLGASVAVNVEPQTVTVNVTSSGNGRLGRSKITNLEVGKFYEYSIEVVSFNLPNKASMTGHIMGVGYTPLSGTQALSAQSANLVPGGRIGIRFQASTVAEYFRCGLNINNAGLPLTVGDSIVFTRPAVYEVSGLSGSLIDYGWSPYGPVGGVAADYDAIGSCVLCCGDSWFDAVTDPPALLASTYRREVILSATGGYRLDQIDAALGTLIAGGWASLNPSRRYPPGIAIIEGGINDITASATGWTMWSRMQSILAKLAEKNIVPIIITPTLPTDSTYSDASTRAASDLYHQLVRESGVAYIDGPANFCNADGTANTALMTDDAGAHLHLLTAGINLLTRLIDEKIRSIEAIGATASSSIAW